MPDTRVTIHRGQKGFFPEFHADALCFTAPTHLSSVLFHCIYGSAVSVTFSSPFIVFISS